LAVDLLLVNPADSKQADSWHCPPLGLMCLAAVARQAGYEVALIDGNIVGWDGIQRWLSTGPGAVGITCLTNGRHQAARVALMAGELGINRVIMGGAHIGVPGMVAQMADLTRGRCGCYVAAEGERFLLNWLKGGEWCEPRPANEPPEPFDLSLLPTPAWDLLERCNEAHLSAYPSWPTANLHFSRGCLGACTFCHAWNRWGKWRHRPPDAVAEEMVYLQRHCGVQSFEFHDDLMTGDAGAVHDLCLVLKQMAWAVPVAWGCTTRADLVDDELLADMRTAGCRQMALGLESGSDAILRTINKGVTREQNVAGALAVKRAGLTLTALMMVGNPGETEETIGESVSMLRAVEPDRIGTIGKVWVFPGSQQWSRLKKEHGYSDDYWLEDQGPPIWPAGDDATLARWTHRVHNEWR
jgi:hypothetical protein